MIVTRYSGRHDFRPRQALGGVHSRAYWEAKKKRQRIRGGKLDTRGLVMPEPQPQIEPAPRSPEPVKILGRYILTWCFCFVALWFAWIPLSLFSVIPNKLGLDWEPLARQLGLLIQFAVPTFTTLWLGWHEFKRWQQVHC